MAQDEGVVKTDQGQIDSAKLNLVYCHIAAPITGRVGLRLVDPGNIVHATDANGLLVITQIQPISVIFTVAEDDLPRGAPQDGRRAAFERSTPTTAANTTKIGHRDAGDGGQPDRSDHRHAAAARQFRQQRQRSCSPTSSSTCACWWRRSTASRWCPRAVIQRTTNSTYVYLVKADHTVTVRQIAMGVTEGDDTEITSGVAPGDVLVMTGVDKLHGRRPRGHAFRMADEARPPRQVRREEEVSPSRTFILRPVATSLLMIGILLAGGVAYKQLPVSALPEVDYPTIQVITFYPGASPDVMASSVTAPLERQFGQVPGLQQMTSTSSDGSSVITLQFNLSLNIDVAEQEVQQSINASGTFLPVGPSGPADLRQDQPGRHADSDPGADFQDRAALQGGGSGRHAPGAQDLAIARRRPGEHQRRTEAGRAHSGEPHGAGLLRPEPGGPAQRHRGRQRQPGQGQLRRRAPGLPDRRQRPVALLATTIAPLIVAYRNGAPVKLTDVADVIDDVENVRQAAWMNEAPAVIMNIQRQPGANIIPVVDRIKQLLPQLTATLPKSVQVSILTDRTNTIRASVEDVQFELMLTIGAGGDGDLPVPAQRCGHHHSQRGRAALAGGHVRRDVPARLQPQQPHADGADHLHRLRGGRRHRDDREHRALHRSRARRRCRRRCSGAEQIGFTIISLTVSLIAVLIPLLFMGDIVGRLFREFAVTLAVTILVSAVVSLTLTPMMCAKLLKHKPRGRAGPPVPRLGARLRGGDRALRQDAAVRAALADRHAAGGGRHAGPHVLPVLHHPQGLLPHPGYGRHSGRFGSGADRVVSRDGRRCSSSSPR